MSLDRSHDRMRIQADLDEWLRRGGVIEKLPPGATSGRALDDFNNRLWDGETRAPRVDPKELPSYGRD